MKNNTLIKKNKTENAVVNSEEYKGVIVSKCLLSDEMDISNESWQERKLLINEISKLPKEAITQIRHFQPQIGCLNNCIMCSQLASNKSVYWNEERQRNIVAALKYVALQFNDKFPLIAQGRTKHRPGVVFSYLDNDIGNYFYLDKFIELLYKELGVKTRISTVGYSRHNTELNIMHAKLNSKELMKGLGGVRVSFTPYAKGWNNSNKIDFSNEEYIEDIANFLKIYRPYYDFIGAGSRNLCVELRYKPLVVKSRVFKFIVNDHLVISTGNYMFISLEKNIELREARISNPFANNIELNQEEILMASLNLNFDSRELEILKKFALKSIEEGNLDKHILAKLYSLKNTEGIYYSINPSISEKGNYGINIYPLTDKRTKEGYLITERFLLNALAIYKSKMGLNLLDKFENATWEDVENVIKVIGEIRENYVKIQKFEKVKYIDDEILTMVKSYILMLKKAGYEAKTFFDPGFTIDTGIICNLGRGYEEFKDITSMRNEPLTPTHERNYGKHNSTMTVEGITWRISCDYDNNILIQKRDLSNTSGAENPVLFSKKIKLQASNEYLKSEELKTRYLIPGQRKRC